MTKEEWAFIRQTTNDVAGYAKDAYTSLRGKPSEDKARVALQRLQGARAALDTAEHELEDYLSGDWCV